MDRLSIRHLGRDLCYQRDTVFAVFPDATAALRGLAALEASGLPRAELDIISGEPGYDARPHGLLTRFTDGYDELRGYAAQMAAGRAVVTAHVADRAAAHRTGALLAETGGRDITYLAPWTVEALAGAAPDAVAAPADGLSGRIAAGASTTIGTYLLPAVLGAFHARYPGVALSLAIADTARILARLGAGELDIGIVEGPITPGLVSDFVLIDRLVVIVSPAHPSAHLETMGVAALAHEPFLLREPGSGTRDAVLRGLARYGVTPTVVMEIGSTAAITRAVRAGLGLSIVSELAVAEEVAAGHLHSLTLAEGPLERELTVVRRPGDQTPQVEQRFLATLRSQLAPVAGGTADSVLSSGVESHRGW